MKKLITTVLAIATIMLSASTMQAAMVTLTNSTLNGAGDLSSLGVLLDARNTGGGGPVSVGGINFLSGGTPLGHGFTGANPASAIGDAGFDTLLNTESFGTTPLMFTNLNPGANYQGQLFFTDNRGCCSGRTVTVNDGGINTVTTPAIGTPQLIDFSFTADAVTQSLNFSGSAGIGYLGGFQLRGDTAAVEPTQTTISAINLTGALNLSQNGTLVEAFNTGGGPALSVAGINFASAGPLLGSQFTGANPGNLTSDGNLNTILNSETFGNGTIDLDNLTAGNLYEVQFVMTDNRTCCAGRDVDIFALDATFTTLPIGTPQLVTSIFEARSGTFSFNFTGSANLGYLGGYQLRDLGAARSDVPEPASALLGLLGLAGLARRRRRAA